MKLLLFISILFLNLFSSENDTEKMPWSESQPLTWQDFQGTPNGSADYVASTNSGMSFSYSYREDENGIKVSYEVNSNFYPKLSWFRPERVDAYILKHEQTHFDITELHARKLRKQLAEFKFSRNTKAEVEALYQRMERQRQEMQHTFDRETNHSQIKDAEERWEAYVLRELKSYERWK